LLLPAIDNSARMFPALSYGALAFCALSIAARQRRTIETRCRLESEPMVERER
jgi:hypothetical protein